MSDSKNGPESAQKLISRMEYTKQSDQMSEKEPSY